MSEVVDVQFPIKIIVPRKIIDVSITTTEQPSLEQMMVLCENLDQGLRLATQVIADLDGRVRKLELALKKNERKLVIANQMPIDAARQ